MESPFSSKDLECLLLTSIYQFENLALGLYQKYVPELNVEGKKHLVQLLSKHINLELLNQSSLGSPLNELLQVAKGENALKVLVQQGLILEPLGQAIYKILGDKTYNEEKAVISPQSYEILTLGLKVSRKITEEIPRVFKNVMLNTSESIFEIFTENSSDLLSKLEDLSEAIDEIFGEPFGLQFSDLVGEFTSEILPLCMELNMNRRKLVCHLTSAFMGA